VLTQIATSEASEVLKELAETLPDAPQNQNRKLMAKYAYEELQTARIRRPD
jgi:hypothetical protein